jgi:sugar phosphate isomerase/epimerase
MLRTAIQLQTLESVEYSLPKRIEWIGESSLDGVEFAGLDEIELATVVNALDEANLETVGAHIDPTRIEDDYDDLVEVYRELGCTRLVFPGRNPETFRTADDVERLADRLSSLSTRLADDGFDLYYHNDRYEFTIEDEQSMFEAFVDALDREIGLEIDIGLAAYAGADPVSLLRRYGDRTTLVHLTDSVEGTSGTAQVELGAGTVDIDGCIDACLESATEWLVYEHGQTNDPLASLHHGATRMETLLARAQRNPAV